MQLGYTYTSRDLLRHSVSARRGMRLRIFDARRARSEHAREFGPDDDPSPRARFPVGARRGDPFSTMRQPFDEAHLGEARDVAARRGRRARAAPRCAARERAPTCGGQARAPVGTAVPEDAERERSRSLKPSASSSTIHPEAPSCRFCFEGPAFGALISPCACSGTQAHVHIKCLRRWQRTTRSADGGRTCQVCRRMFLAPPLSFYERSARAAWRAARRAPRPSRCCRRGWPWTWRARKARRPCSAGAAPWRSPPRPRRSSWIASACTASPPRTSGKTRTRTSPPWRCRRR